MTIEVPGLLLFDYLLLVAASLTLYSLWVQTCRRCIGRMFRRG